jgi:hypothetical protein
MRVKPFNIFVSVVTGLFLATAVGIASGQVKPSTGLEVKVGTQVYWTKNSKHFHTHKECIALHNAKPENILSGPESGAGDRTLCGICAHRKASK